MIYFIGGFSFLRYYLLLIAQRRKDIKEIYNMSKSGRYSADRKKIQAVAADETLVVQVADCGTIFTLAGGAGTSNITLPSIGAAGPGWWCKFVLLANNGSGAITISAETTGTMIASNFGGLDDDSPSANVVSNAAADSIAFDANGALAGDQIEVICTGDKMLVQAFSAGDADDITVA